MWRRWARHLERKEEEKSKFMTVVGNLKKEGTCSSENCIRSFVVTAVTLDFLSTSGRQVIVKWRKGKAPPCNFRPRSLTLQPAAEGCRNIFGNAQSFSCTNLKQRNTDTNQTTRICALAVNRCAPAVNRCALAVNVTTIDTDVVCRQWFRTVNNLLIDYFKHVMVIFINNSVWLLLMVQFVVSSTVFCTGYMYCNVLAMCCICLSSLRSLS
jgi:hypothetical protein